MNIRLIQLLEKAIEDRIEIKRKIRELKDTQEYIYIPQLDISDSIRANMFLADFRGLYVNKWVGVNGDFAVIKNIHFSEEIITEQSQILLFLSTRNRTPAIQQRIQFILHNLEFHVQRRLKHELDIIRRFDFTMEHSNHADWLMQYINTAIHDAQILLGKQL